MSTGLAIGFAGYLILMLTIGIGSWLMSRRAGESESIEGFIVGKKNFGVFTSAAGVATSLASGFAFMGLAGMGYTMGTIALFQLILTPLCELILWRVLAKRVRRHADETGSLTVVELLSRLKGDPYNLIKICGGLLIGGFMFTYLASNFVSGAKAAVVFDIPFTTAVVACALVVIAYTFVGGVNAVMWTDLVQGVMIAISFVAILIMALVQAGGLGTLFSHLGSMEPAILHWNNGTTGWPLAITLMIWWGLALCMLGQPHAVQKFITIRNEKIIPQTAMVSVLFNSLRQVCPILIGMCGRIIFPTLADPELVVPTLLATHFPGIIGGLMLASVFAAIMSTTDSLLLQSASEICRNVLQLSLFKNLSPKMYGFMIKIVTIVIGGLGLWAAITSNPSVFEMTSYAFCGLASAIAPALFFGFLWKRATSWGILSGIVCGIGMTVIWVRLIKPVTRIHEGIGAFLITVAVVIIVSLLTQSANQTTEDPAGAA